MSATQKMIDLISQRDALQKKIDLLRDKQSLLDSQIAAIKPFDSKEATDRRTRQEMACAAIQKLTPTEMRVAELIAADLSNAEIAIELYVNRRTIETHLNCVVLPPERYPVWR
jgi:DNA-binding CsgD family transcriptional regulator